MEEGSYNMEEGRCDGEERSFGNNAAQEIGKWT